MIDADPLFVDEATNDFHLTLVSPCLEAGDNTAVIGNYDCEGDPRIADSFVDIGADEFYAHLYYIGEVIFGAPGHARITGHSPNEILLATSGLQNPPIPLPYGDLWLTLPLAKEWTLGQMPNTGVYVLPVTIPSIWASGEPHYFQALVGNLGYYNSTKLTSFLVLTAQ